MIKQFDFIKEILKFDNTIIFISDNILNKDLEEVTELLKNIDLFLQSITMLSETGYINDPKFDIPLLRFCIKEYKLLKRNVTRGYSLYLNTLFYNLILLMLLEVVIVIETD
jgi:hypothetical protein